MSLAIYIHWPFCQSKCPYCDFNSHVAQTIDHTAWREAYAQEIHHYAELIPKREVTSVFFGGGTPSLMEPQTVALVLESIHKNWRVADDVEITLEANPGSVEAQKFIDFRQAGVNRLSLGIQSLRDDALKFLGRKHDAAQARQALEIAAKNFPRYSFDLIYARHGQSLADWRQELQDALQIAGDHLSLYQLTIEPNTQFYTLNNRGVKLTAPDDEAAVMFEATQQMMSDAGMPAYEISNHAKAGQESRHNLTYWHYKDYIGIGPGAHGRYTHSNLRIATENHKAPDVWLKHVADKKNGLRVSDIIDNAIAQREALMMGLRLTSGIDHATWRDKFGSELSDFLPYDKTATLVSEGYLLRDSRKTQATAAGLQRLNAMLGFLLG